MALLDNEHHEDGKQAKQSKMANGEPLLLHCSPMPPLMIDEDEEDEYEDEGGKAAFNGIRLNLAGR